jgi:hypothetical protein
MLSWVFFCGSDVPSRYLRNCLGAHKCLRTTSRSIRFPPFATQGAGANSTITGVVYVSDAFDASSRSTFAARVSMPVLTVAGLQNQSASLLQDALATSDTDALLSVGDTQHLC